MFELRWKLGPQYAIALPNGGTGFKSDRVLQYRTKTEEITEDHSGVLFWTDWMDVPTVQYHG